uniref:Putative secreted protein n=1 Tax=Lutzomyia longipalpis TaxID=7200 RepID=A0A7G3API1_LUTLO
MFFLSVIISFIIFYSTLQTCIAIIFYIFFSRNREIKLRKYDGIEIRCDSCAQYLYFFFVHKREIKFKSHSGGQRNKIISVFIKVSP